MAEHRPKEERKMQIINAAIKCMKDKGFHNTSLQEIADIANLSKGAVYFHFKNKKELFLAVTGYLIDNYVDNVTKISPDSSPLQVIIELFKKAPEELFNQESNAKIMIEIWQHSSMDKDIFNAFFSIYDKLTRFFEDCLRRGIENKEIKKVELKSTAMLLCGLLDILELGSYFLKDYELTSGIRERIVEMLTSWLALSN